MRLTDQSHDLHGYHVFFKHIEHEFEGSMEEEGVMCIARQSTADRQHRKLVMIPQSIAHAFYYDDEQLLFRCVDYCDRLFGGFYSRDDIINLASIIENFLDDLVMMPPKQEQTAKAVERLIERAGLKASIDGQILVDAS